MQPPDDSALVDRVEEDIWTWIREFVAVPHPFYGGKFAPCPFARTALIGDAVDVVAWRSGDVRDLIRHWTIGLVENAKLSTRVMAFPPRIQDIWGISDFVETLNAEFIPANLFLNIGVAQTTKSRYLGSGGSPYFIVVANRLDAVLQGSERLAATLYYKDWPSTHKEIVVERRARLAARFGGALFKSGLS
jgi:hypothetical protein